MAKPEWGRKRICPSCGTKYYDFKKSPIICPSCGAEFDPDLYLRSRKGKVYQLKFLQMKPQKFLKIFLILMK